MVRWLLLTTDAQGRSREICGGKCGIGSTFFECRVIFFSCSSLYYPWLSVTVSYAVDQIGQYAIISFIFSLELCVFTWHFAGLKSKNLLSSPLRQFFLSLSPFHLRDYPPIIILVFPPFLCPSGWLSLTFWGSLDESILQMSLCLLFL